MSAARERGCVTSSARRATRPHPSLPAGPESQEPRAGPLPLEQVVGPAKASRPTDKSVQIQGTLLNYWVFSPQFQALNSQQI